MNARSPQPSQVLRLGVLLSAALALVACGAPGPVNLSAEAEAGRIKPEDLFIVDCALPPQVRQLGESFTYLSARQPVRTTARDCARRGGEYVAFDRATMASSLRVWLPAAEGGDADAMVHVGEIYEQGLGVQPDHAAAVQWYRRAAETGHSRAQINLGSMYERGLGVPQDLTQAMNWYRRASGIQEGTLEYASADELARRRALEEEAATLRQRVQSLRAELGDARERLDRTESELTAGRSQAEGLRRQLAEQQRSGQDSAETRQRLAALEAEVRSKEQELAQARQSNQRLLSEVSAVSAGQVASGAGLDGPSIALLAPQLTLTRSGVPAAPLLAATTQYQVIGRVEAPDGILSLRLNDQDVTAALDADGLFEVNVNLNDRETPVLIEAITRGGRRVEQNFLITREFEQAIERREVSRMFQRRLRNDLGRYHALVIGNAAYTGYPQLTTAVTDARQVAAVLRERYGYQVTLLTDANRDQMLAAFADLSQRLTESDNLIVYYAGHGEIQGDRGFWIPVDGGSTPEQNWIGNEVLTDFLGAMRARHVLVVADSCYSGTLSGNAIRPIPADVPEQDLLFMSRVKARTVLTSGGLQPVSDGGGDGHSIFARAFLSALQRNDGLLEGYRLYQEVQFDVGQRARLTRTAQRPEYTALRRAGHEGSEFFFLPIEATGDLGSHGLALRY